MGCLFGITCSAGYYLSVKCLLFSPVPGIFFGQQPVYHHSLSSDHVCGNNLFIAAANSCGIPDDSIYPGKIYRFDEQSFVCYRTCAVREHQQNMDNNL